MINPWIILACVFAMGASAAGGWVLGSDHVTAKHAKTEKLIAEVREQAQQGAAEAIAKIDIKYTTINRKVETFTHEIPVYRDCINSPDVERLLDIAREGRPDATGESILPDAGSSPSP